MTHSVLQPCFRPEHRFGFEPGAKMFMVVALAELLPFFLGLMVQFETMHRRDEHFFSTLMNVARNLVTPGRPTFQRRPKTAHFFAKMVKKCLACITIMILAKNVQKHCEGSKKM